MNPERVSQLVDYATSHMLAGRIMKALLILQYLRRQHGGRVTLVDQHGRRTA